MSHLNREVPANLTGPGPFSSEKPSSLSNPAGRWALLAHSALFSSSEFECYITPIIILPGDSGFWMKGDEHSPTYNAIARSSQIYIIDPPQRTPLWTPPVPSRPVDSIIPGRTLAISTNTCMPAPIGCGKPITEFRDSLSRREYFISALCQSCQDSVFPPPPEDTTDWDAAELADEPNSGVDSEIEFKPSILDPDLFDDRDRNDSRL
jgi:hypothetical protein